jgi:hypothetical protein
MFQIASVIGIAKKNNNDYFFPEWEYQDFFEKTLPLCKGEFLAKLTLTEGAADYRDSNIPEGKIYSMFGYFQSFKYFETHKDEVASYFEPKQSIVHHIENKYKSYKNKTSIHIRRADYVTLQDFHTLLDMDYYHLAIETIGKDEEFLIFSDDIEWCKDNFKDYACEYVEERPHDQELICCMEEHDALRKHSTKVMDSLNYKLEDVTELILMSMCKNNIIANSSFSWWAAYLNKNPDKKIIAPRYWFTEERASRIYRDSKNYIYQKIPDSWTLLPQ